MNSEADNDRAKAPIKPEIKQKLHTSNSCFCFNCSISLQLCSWDVSTSTVRGPERFPESEILNHPFEMIESFSDAWNNHRRESPLRRLPSSHVIQCDQLLEDEHET